MKGETRPIRRAKESRGRRLRFGAAAATCLLLLGSLGGGCAAQTSMKGIETKMERLIEFTSGTKTKIDNSRNRGDRWSERLAIIGLCSYPLGKIIWLIVQGLKDRAAMVVRGPLIRRRLKDSQTTS